MVKNEQELYEARREKFSLKKIWSNPFLNELELILEKCFLKPKSKKEHFITKEKLEVELIKLLQTQKKFAQKESNFKGNLTAQACYDKIDNGVGKILNIDMVEKKVKLFTIHNKFVERDFDDVCFFDVYSMQLLPIFEQQKNFYSFTYRETYRFLTHIEDKKEERPQQVNLRYQSKEKLCIPIDYGKL